MPTHRSELEDKARRVQSEFDEWLRNPDQGAPAGELVREIRVLAETGSTQDACRNIAQARTGVCCIALFQHSGRGRFGRTWNDEPGSNLAMTVALPFDQSAERVSIRAGLAACLTVESFLQRKETANPSTNRPRIGIRWPNDVMIDRAKICGILIEVHEGIAFVGIGINVNQVDWPSDLNQPATSLRIMTSRKIPVASVAKALLIELGRVQRWDDHELSACFAERDLLRDRVCDFDVRGEGPVRGRVRRIDPMHGIEIEVIDEKGKSDQLMRHLPGALTSRINVEAH